MAGYVDPSLARGIVRMEERSVARRLDLHSMVLDGVDLAGRAVSSGIGRNARDRAVRSLAGILTAAEAESDCFLDLYLGWEPSHVPGRSDLYSRGVYVAPGAEDAFQLRCVTVEAWADNFKASVTLAPLSFGRHLAERILQRRRSERVGEITSEVASALMGAVGLFVATARQAHALPQRRTALPFHGGLILGDVSDVAHDSRVVLAHSVDTGRALKPIYPSPVMLRPSAGGASASGRSLVLRGTTFVSESQLRPDQRDLRDALAAVSLKHSGHLWAGAENILFPPGRYEPPLSSMSESLREAYDAVEEIYARPRFAHAMGNSGTAAVPITPLRELIRLSEAASASTFMPRKASAAIAAAVSVAAKPTSAILGTSLLLGTSLSGAPAAGRWEPRA